MTKNAIAILALIVVLLAILTIPATAYTIDGNLSDWGLDNWYLGLNNGPASYWVPSSSTCDWIVEDNRDPDRNEGDGLWFDYKDIKGVHIKGTGSTYTDYDEWTGIAQPAGGELFDIEAMYFDSDSDNVYVAVITSFQEDAVGDLKIEIGGTIFGIVLQGDDKAKVIEDPKWHKTSKDSKPPGWPDSWDAIDNIDFRVEKATGKPTGSATVYYVHSRQFDNAHHYPGYYFDGANYIIEISAPRSALGDPSDTALANLYLTLWCANDVIELEDATTEVPEFTTIALPALSIIGLYVFFSHRKRKQE